MEHLQNPFSASRHMLSDEFEICYFDDIYYKNTEDHEHDYYELFFFLEGSVNMRIDGNPYPLSPGDVLLIPPLISHHAVNLQPEKSCRCFVLWIRRDYLHRLQKESPCYAYFPQLAENCRNYRFHYDIITFNTLQSKVLRLLEEMHSERFGKSEKITLCLKDLILHLNRLAYESVNPEMPQEKQRLYENLLSYIERHLTEELTLDDLASEFFVSKYHIAHLFKEHLGISIHQYIIKKRLAMCREAILGSAHINKVYLTYGFKDYSSFYRAFCKEYGVSPKEYREIHSVSKEH